MSGKQVVWRCSKAFFPVILLVLSTYSFSKEEKEEWHGHPRTELVENAPRNIPVLGNEKCALAPALTEEQKERYVCCGSTWRDMMTAYNDAPYDAQVIVDHLKKPLHPAWRAAFFVGLSSTGKTTTALAIPHLAHWYFDFISSTQLLGSHRNQAKERLELHLKRAISLEKKVVVIIDNINLLLSSDDGDATSGALWAFLDSQKYNNNFFLIGTMDCFDNLSEDFKRRAIGSIVEFGPIPSSKLKAVFKSKITSPAMELDTECDDEFIDACVSRIEREGRGVCYRDCENIGVKVSLLTYKDAPESVVRKIKRKHINEAIEYWFQNLS